jgi:hypothetical protein
LVRRKKERVLNREESNKLPSLAPVIERAAEVFEDGPATQSWIKVTQRQPRRCRTVVIAGY